MDNNRRKSFVNDPSDAFAMMAMATLKVIRPSVTAARMKTHYLRTFVCMDYPGAALSQNSIGNLLQRIGMDGSKRKRFYRLRMTAGGYTRCRLSLMSLRHSDYPNRCPSRNPKNAGASPSQRNRPSRLPSVSADGRERMPSNLPVLYSPADWESINE